MMQKQLVALVFASILGICFATLGVDVSTPISAWRSTGTADPNAPATVKNAWAAGMAHVDVYLFPCPRCGNPAGQVIAAVDALRAAGVNYGMLWLDIEGPQYWMDQTSNRNFFSGLLDGARARNQKIGIYTSASQWGPIMGSTTAGSAYPLWYAHYDNSPNFGDFKPFGGWTKPAIKQFAGDVTVCGVGVDKNWYP